jgi:hypothetical protein
MKDQAARVKPVTGPSSMVEISMVQVYSPAADPCLDQLAVGPALASRPHSVVGYFSHVSVQFLTPLA